jgi:nucleoside-diphosphate-sugar epimerase
MADRGLALVTGGSGYIAGFCIAHLLQHGWRVRATVRSLAREAEARASVARLVDPGDRLSFVAADLNEDGGWPAAVAGCDYVLHVASPLPLANPRHDDELVRPARDGALRVLRAARDAGVRRVVLTASTAAIAYGRGGRDAPFTESDWSDATVLSDSSAYERSKTLAERAAWDWMAREGGALELVTICPGAVLGPVLGRDASASLDIVKKLLDGSLPGLPRFGWPLVDVRDIADLHYRAMLAPEAAGQRYIGAGRFFWMADIAAALRAGRPGLARRLPRFVLPNWLVRLSSRFDPVVRERLFELDKHRPVSADKARRDLGWIPRPGAETIVATADSLIAEGLVKA